MFVTSGVISAKRKYVESVENQWQTWQVMFLNSIDIGDIVNVLLSKSHVLVISL